MDFVPRDVAGRGFTPLLFEPFENLLHEPTRGLSVVAKLPAVRRVDVCHRSDP